MARKNRKKGMRRKHIKHVGVTAGLIGTAIQIALSTPNAGYSAGKNPVAWAMEPGAKFEDRIAHVYTAVKDNALTVEAWIPAAIGGIATAAPRIPLIRIVASPVSQGIRSMSRQKWGL